MNIGDLYYLADHPGTGPAVCLDPTPGFDGTYAWYLTLKRAIVRGVPLPVPRPRMWADGTIDCACSDAPPYLLRLRPPVDARYLEQTLRIVRLDQLIAHRGSTCIVTVEDEDIVVREAVQ